MSSRRLKLVSRLALAGAVLVLVSFAATLRWDADLYVKPWGILIRCGTLAVARWPGMSGEPSFSARRSPLWHDLLASDIIWRPSLLRRGSLTGPGPINGVVLPLWLPLAALLLVSGACRWFARVRRGHCKCGYDLRGNISGTCPECGAPLNPRTACEPRSTE